MGRATIRVDLRNPGQVFACLGFLEAADILCGPAEGGFDWSADEVFVLEAEGADNPVETVLAFLSSVTVRRVVPRGWVDPPKKKKGKKSEDGDEKQEDIDRSEISDCFPAGDGEGMALPIRFGGGNLPIVELNHWADGSGRNTFKLYAGNRSAAKIASDMLGMIQALWATQRQAVIEKPLDVLCPMAGSFNFDPRGARTAIDAGYSPDKHKIKGANIFASPVVEFMVAWVMQNARPNEYALRQLRYSVWQEILPPILARATMSYSLTTIRGRRFRFSLALSGKNKVNSFSLEEFNRE
jgi:CRISPR-associated protein Csx14